METIKRQDKWSVVKFLCFPLIPIHSLLSGYQSHPQIFPPNLWSLSKYIFHLYLTGSLTQSSQTPTKNFSFFFYYFVKVSFLLKRIGNCDWTGLERRGIWFCTLGLTRIASQVLLWACRWSLPATSWCLTVWLLGRAFFCVFSDGVLSHGWDTLRPFCFLEE